MGGGGRGGETKSNKSRAAYNERTARLIENRIVKCDAPPIAYRVLRSIHGEARRESTLNFFDGTNPTRESRIGNPCHDVAVDKERPTGIRKCENEVRQRTGPPVVKWENPQP